MAKRRKSKKKPASRRLASCLFAATVLGSVAIGATGNWYVHHPKAWLAERRESWPNAATWLLEKVGNPVADITDGLGWTGHDAVYEYDEPAPEGAVTFAGSPKRVHSPAPDDIRVIDRGEFIVGWSDKLRHPAWCAYHVVKDAKFEDGKRPSFIGDKSVPAAPRPDSYTKSGFDRGHMVPNHAIVSRYGDDERRKTFLMSNIAPQTPQLNRGVWRDVEHRIADLWTARYGEIWVVVGCIPSSTNERFGSASVDVPEAYFQVIIAQEGLDVRALAVLIRQDVTWDSWAAREIVTIDELERLTGYDFNPELPGFIQDPLEAELPTRLWPVRPRDILKQVRLRFM